MLYVTAARFVWIDLCCSKITVKCELIHVQVIHLPVVHIGICIFLSRYDSNDQVLFALYFMFLVQLVNYSIE